MTKQDFITGLRRKLSGLPSQEVEERLSFYSEMIDDQIEEGRAEADAVAAFGSLDEIATQIISDIPFSKIAKEKIKTRRRLQVWEIVLLAVGSPLWITLLAAAFVVILSLYVVLWSLVISVWAVFVSLAACSLGGLISSIGFVILGHVHSGIALLGAAAVCAGLSIFLFFGCLAATKGTARLSKLIAVGIKKCFARRDKV